MRKILVTATCCIHYNIFVVCTSEQYFVLREMGVASKETVLNILIDVKIRFYVIFVLRLKRYVKLMSKYINSYVVMLDEMENLLISIIFHAF
jgi:hypothetical protein